MRKETVKSITIVILVLVLIFGVFYTMVLPMYNQGVYNQGVVDGQTSLIQQQMATGNIALIDSNGTVSTRSIVEICETAS